MNFLSPQIAAMAKKKKPSLIRKQVFCGIFQEIDEKAIGKEVDIKVPKR